MKKILYLITQSELGGAQKYVLDLARLFSREAEVVVAFGEQGESGELVAKLKQYNIEYYAIRHLKRSISPADDLRALFGIAGLIRRLKPDVVHLNSSKISILGSLGAFLAKLTFTRTRVVYTAHGWVFNEPLPFSTKTFYRIAEKFTAHFKQKIICVSAHDYEAALKEGMSKRKLAMVHNGIEKPNFEARDAARRKLEDLVPGLKQASSFIIGSIGNLYKTKGFEYLIDAVKLLRDNGKNLALVIIGEGTERPALTDWIAQNKLEKDVFLPGRIDNAAALLKAFDVYACSSVKEGLSYTILEAMLAGLPIVATEVGGNAEMIRDSETGLLCPAAKPQVMAECLLRYFNDRELRESMGKEAEKVAEAEFSFTKMYEKTKEAYGI